MCKGLHLVDRVVLLDPTSVDAIDEVISPSHDDRQQQNLKISADILLFHSSTPCKDEG